MENRRLLAAAWIGNIAASSLGVILWQEALDGMPAWWPMLHAAVLLLLLGGSYLRKELRGLRGYFTVLTAVFLLGYGGGWRWGVIPWVRGAPEWAALEAQGALGMISTHLLRLLPAAVTLTFLLLQGRSRASLYLVKGDTDAQVQPSRLLGTKPGDRWPRTAGVFAAAFTLGTLAFLLLTRRPPVDALVGAAAYLPVGALIAGLNGFNEEWTLRGAPLSTLVEAVGRDQALLLTTLQFALGHYYGVPSGVAGVLLSGFLGWFLGKSIIETRGFAYAWVIHALPDLVIFTFFAAGLL